MNTIRLNTIGEVVAKKTSGGAVVVPSSDVNFYDSDGTILYSYTAEDFLALTELPALPKKEGLICQGWNVDLEYLKDSVVRNGRAMAGATYITDDGCTRLYIRAEVNKSVVIRFAQSVANGVVIDWGDGNLETYDYATDSTLSHTYDLYGDYIISLLPNDGCKLELGSASLNYSIMNTSSNDNSASTNSAMLRKVEIGKNVTTLGASFLYCPNLEYITLPKELTSIGDYAFYNCNSLRAIVVPYNTTSLGANVFRNCQTLYLLIFPKGLSTIGTYSVSSNYSMVELTLPDGITDIPNSNIYYMYTLAYLRLPQGLLTIGNYFCYNCYNLQMLKMPKSVTSIGSNFGASSNKLKYVDFSEHEAVPLLRGGTTLPPIVKVIVPDALYDEWIAATNWSNYASKIIKKSDWDASQS